MNDNINILYSSLQKEGFEDIGTEEQFRNYVKKPENVGILYEALAKEGYEDIGSADEFSKWITSLPANAEKNKTSEQGEQIDYVTQSSQNLPPIALREEAVPPLKDQSEYVNPWTNSPDYNFESLRKKGKIETAHSDDKKNGFWDTYAGDVIEKIGSGAASLGASGFGILDKATQGIENMGLGTRKGAFKDSSDWLKEIAENLRNKSNRYVNKNYRDLWNEGDYLGAVGDIALQGAESLPMSIGAMAAAAAGSPVAGLAGIGALTASDKYDQLDEQNPNMGGFAKTSNAIITGLAEGGSEMLGGAATKAWMGTLYKTLGKEKAKEVVKKGFLRELEKHFKEFGIFYEPVAEGLEEVSSQFAENVTDKITGADPERKVSDGLGDSFIYGIGGGAYFSAAGAPAYVKQRISERRIKSISNNIAARERQRGLSDSEDIENIKRIRYTAQRNLTESETKARQLFGDDFDALKINLEKVSAEKGDDAVAEMMQSDRFIREQKEAILDYYRKRSYHEGLMLGENKRIEETVQAEVETIRSEANLEAGMFIEASRIDPLSGERIPGTIVQGSTKDDKDRVTWKGADGEVKMILRTEIDPSTVRSAPIQDVIDASIEAIKRNEQDQISRDSKYNPEILSPEETLGQVFYVDGNPYIFKYENGGLKAYLVDINGQPIKAVDNVSVDDYYIAKQEEIDYEESSKDAPLYKLSDGRIARLIAKDEEEVAVEILDRDGVPIDNFTMPTERFNTEASVLESQGQNEQVEIDSTADGDEYSRFVDTGEVSDKRVNDIVSKIIRGESLSPEEESMRAGAAQRVEDKLKEASNATNTSQVEAENAIVSSGEESNVSQNTTALEKSPADVPEQNTPTAIPADKDGNLLYHLAPVDVTLADILDGTLDSNEIDAFVDENKKAAGAFLKRVNEKPPKMSTNKAKYLAQKKAWSDRVAEAEQQVAYWNQVESVLKESRMKPGDKASDEIKSMGEPLTGEELAAMMLADGSIKLTKESYKRETGAGEEEAKKMFGLFASVKNGGVSIERAGELVMLADLENGTHHFDQEDPNAGRNAIIEVLSSARTRGDLIDYVKNNRAAMAERERQAEYNAYAEWCEEMFHMSPEDYEAYEEQVMKDIATRNLDEASYNELMSIFAIQQNTNEDEKQQNVEQSGTGGIREGGREILPGEESISAERVRGTEKGSSTADGDLNSEDGTAQEGSSEDIKPIGKGPFGDIYNQFKGKAKEAIRFLLGKKNGEAIGALYHKDVGDIDLVWGKEGTGKSNGFGLSKLVKFHPEVLDDLQDIINDMEVVSRTDNRINLESKSHRAAVRLEWDGKKKNWLLTAFEKEKPTAIDRTTDIGDTELQNDTAPLQTEGLSIDKDNISSIENQTNEAKSFVAPAPKENENPLDYAERIVEAKKLYNEERKVDTNPTEAQKEAGNYKKGHIKIDGFDVTIEQPAGSVRSGKDADGKEWSVTMNNTYGYIRGAEGVDGDHIDIFLSDNPISGNVYVVDQVNADGSFDEHKVMYGFTSMEDAADAYLSNYSPDWQGLGAISEVSKDDFKKWVDSSRRKTKPFIDYKSVKIDAVQSADSGKFAVNDNSSQKNSDETAATLPENIVIAENAQQNETLSPTLKAVDKKDLTFSKEENNDNIRFREVKEKEGSKSLIGVHNISEDKILKALKQGGFANPSAAIIDIDRQSHEGYGAISLVLPSSMVEKRAGRNAGTFEQDAWTPTYPQVEKKLSDKGSARLRDDLSSLPEEMRSIMRTELQNYMDGRGSTHLAYMFLYERGDTPEIFTQRGMYSEKTKNGVTEATNGKFSLFDLNKEGIEKIKNLFVEEKWKGNRKYFDESLKNLRERWVSYLKEDDPKSFRYKKAKQNLELMDQFGFSFNDVQSFVNSVKDDLEKSGKTDRYATMENARKYVEENNLKSEFDKWLERLNERYDITEVIFDGFTPSGYRRYVPNTLENVSKIMKRSGRAGATGIGISFQNFAAGLLKAKGTLKDIRAGKSKLTSDYANVDAFRDKWSKVFYDLGEKLQPDAKGYDDYGLARLAEAARSKNPKKYIEEEYGINFSEEDIKQLNEMIEAIRNEYPAMYFETKFERPVMLDEFVAAVVPDGIDGRIIEAMKKAGLEIFTYKAENEFDRNETLKKASKIEGVRFRTTGSEVNQRFNEELQRQIYGTLPEGHVYQLGKPSEFLQAAGIPNLPIELPASQLAYKATSGKHDYDLSAVINLPDAIARPIATFSYGDKGKSQNILTMLEHNGENFIVGMFIKPKVGGRVLEVNSVRNVFPKNNASIVKWIIQGKLTNADKEKLLNFLDQQRTNHADVAFVLPGEQVKQGNPEVQLEELSSATKIIENFQNPTPTQGEIISEIEDLSSKLHTPVTIIHDIDEITDENEKTQFRKRSSKGWYDPQTQEIVVVLPNNTSVADATRTFLHEAVAHYGLREMFSDNFDAFLGDIYAKSNEQIRRNIQERTKGNPLALREATEEYLADLAEYGFDDMKNRSFWQKIKDAFVTMLRKAGIDLGYKLSDNDLRYILWRSYRNLEYRNLLDLAEDISMRNKLGIGKSEIHNDNITPDVLYRDNNPHSTSDGKKSHKKKGNLSKDERIIKNLRERIDRMDKNSQQIEDVKKDLVNEIKNRIDSKDASRLNKQDLMSLLRQVRDIKTKEDMGSKLMEVERISYEIKIRSTQRDIDKSLSLKTQDVNGKNMSIAKNVDDSTRRIFQLLRGKLSDLKVSGYKQEMTDLRRRNRELRELIEINKRKSLYEDLSDSETQSFANEINTYEQEIEANKSRLSDLKEVAAEIRNAKAEGIEVDLDGTIDELKAKMSAAASGSAIWKREDSEQLTALNIIKSFLKVRKYDRGVENTLSEIEAKLRNNSKLYRNMTERGKGIADKGEAKEMRSRVKEIIAENKRQIVCLRKLYNEIRRSQLDVLKSTQEQLTELINDGKDALRKMTEEEIERGRSIIRNSLDDVIDKPIDINNMKADEMNFLKKFFSAPLGSFDYMAQRIGRKFFNGEGYIYQHFVKGENGTIACENTYAQGIRYFRDTFDAKAKEIFGKSAESVLYASDKKIKDTGIYMIDTRPGATYGQKIEKEFTKGEGMYLYMVWKMNDGRMKLEKQGVDEDTMREIEDFIGPQYRKLADWIQDDLLVDLRDKYNERYLEMYHTQMANIPNYVPLRINKNAVVQESNLEDSKRREKSLEERTRSLINRKVNDKPVDLTANGIGVIFEHVKEMEEWYAFARLRRDLDYILGNIEFRNRVNANAHGHFSNFKDAAVLASHSHSPSDPGISDTFWSKLSKGVVGGNIAFRLNTALKQIYSLPAFLAYSQSPKFMTSLAKNIGLGLAESASFGKMKGTYRWCMENMPLFYERVKEGDAGNEKLQNKGFGRGIDKYLKTGMIPNKLVDAFTVAIGAKTIYEYTYDRLTNGTDKVAPEEARRQALVDADIFFNQSQQSGINTFLSPMQRSRSMLDIAFTTYQNSNIGYVRKVMLNFYDLVKLKDWDKLRGNYVEKYRSDGIDENKAYGMATSKLLNDSRRQLFGLMLFGWGMDMLWKWGSRGLMGFFAGDDENDEYKDIVKYLTSPIRGVPIESIVSNLVEGYDINPVIFMDEIVHAWRSITKSYNDNGIDPILAIDILSNGSKLSGFDLEMWGNIYLGIEGAVRHFGREGYKMQDLLFFLNTPKSQRVKVAQEMYKDSSLLDFAEKISRAYRYTPMSDNWEYWVPGAERMTRSKMNKIKKMYWDEKMTDEQKEKLKERKELEKKMRRAKEWSIDPGL